MSEQNPVPPTPQQRDQLCRSHDRWLGGVCGGIGTYTGLDVNLVRALTVLGVVVGFGSLVVVYLLAWLLMPAPASDLAAHPGATVGR